MSEFKPKVTYQFKVQIELTETEARALEAMTAYGHKPFLQGFYTKLGKSYMQPYEAGIVSLFENIKATLSPQLYLVDKAKDAIKKINTPEKL